MNTGDNIDTPLHTAAKKGDINLLRHLLQLNSYDVDCLQKDSYTPLHCAAESGNLEVCKILLRAGANTNLKTNHGDTPLQLLSSHSFDNDIIYRSVIDMMLKQSCSKYTSDVHRKRSHSLRSNTEFDKDDDSDDDRQFLTESSSEEYINHRYKEDSDEEYIRECKINRKKTLIVKKKEINLLEHDEFDDESYSPSHDSGEYSSQELVKTKRVISYPPSPLSTEFETTESSEIGTEQFTILPCDFESEKEQIIGNSVKDVLFDAFKLKMLRSRAKGTNTTVPSVLLQKENPTIPSPRHIISNTVLTKRYKRSFSDTTSAKSYLPSRTSVGRLIRRLLDPSQASIDPFFVVDFLDIHRFFLTPQTLLKTLILRYSFNTDESVPKKVNCSILKTRTRILEIMSHWLRNVFPDFRLFPDVIKTSSQFVEEISKSDDPPETLPIKEILELKETVNHLLYEIQQPFELPEYCNIKLFKDNSINFRDVTANDLAEELTLYLNEKLCKIIAIDFALFYQNEDILLSCPNIVNYYETIDILKRWIATVIIVQSTRKKRADSIEYFITLANKCLFLRNYQASQLILQTLTSTSIGRLNETWGIVSTGKVTILQNIMNVLSTSVNFGFCSNQSLNESPLIPDIEMIFQELSNHCTSSARKKIKINFKQARKVLEFTKYVTNVKFSFEKKPQIRHLLHNLQPLPTEMINYFSHSNESSETGKPKSISLTIHGLTCRITRGTLSVLHGKIEDLLDLLLDIDLSSLNDSISEELFLTYRYYISSADLFYQLLQRLELPPMQRYSISEQAVILKRQILVRKKIIELLKKWFAMHASRLRKDTDVKRVILDFFNKSEMLSTDETFFFITTLRNSFLTRANKVQSRVHRLKEGVDNFSLASSSWTNDILYKQHFPKLAARQICLIEYDLFKKITAMDLLSYSAGSNSKTLNIETENLVDLWSIRFNTVSSWVSTLIVQQNELEKRVIVLRNFIKLAYTCLVLNNFNTSYAIFASLYSLSISRLHKTWKELSPKIMDKFSKLEYTFDTVGGHRNYQKALSEVKPPVIPWLGIYTKHIFSIREHNPDIIDEKYINFEKFSSLVKIIRTVFELQSSNYDFTPDPSAYHFLTELKVMSESDINSTSQKLEINKVQNPVFQANKLINQDVNNIKILKSKKTLEFTKKTFVDEEGRKTIHVKNPIFQNAYISKSYESSTEEKSNTTPKIKRKGLRRFFQSNSPSL